MIENKEKLKQVFLKVFQNLNEKDFDFNKERSSFENWDSLTHMQLISETENSLGINFEIDEVIEINKPADILALIQKKNG